MGTENARSDIEELPGPPQSGIAIPLPPPPSFVEKGTCPQTTWASIHLDTCPFTTEFDCLITSVDQNASSDMEDGSFFVSSREPGICGLRNLGNTCFMSAGIQCLVVTSPLVQTLLYRTSPDPHHGLTIELTDLARKMWSGEFTSLQPLMFKKSLALYFPQFNDFRQHDCQEFLALLLDGLHEQLNTAINKDIGCQVRPQEFKVDSELKEASTSNGCPSRYTRFNLSDGNMLLRGPLAKRLHKEVNISTAPCINSSDLISTSSSTERLNNLPSVSVMGLPGSRYGEVGSDGDGAGCSSSDSAPMNNAQSSPDVISQNNSLCILNNTVGQLSGLDDILKDAKTSNVNVLTLEQDANNEIRFDSEKFPRIDNIKCKENFNFNYFNDDNPMNVKRCKKTMTHYNSVSDGLDLKRVKLYCSDEEDVVQSCSWKGEKNKRMELERKHLTLDCKLLEKNCRLEYERKKQLQERELISDDKVHEGRYSTSAVFCMSSSSENQVGESEADKHWQQHLAANRSIIVDTFQGQFKSTVVCSYCKYISVTYEPFMYLSVPLPNALRKQICVTHVGGCGSEVTELTVEVNRHDNIGSAKEKVIKMIDGTNENIIMGEVFNHHIAKILDDSHLVRDLNGLNRSLYSFEVVTLCEELASLVTEEKKDSSIELDTYCTICLEDKEVNMHQHIGCTCVLCDICVMASCQHHGGNFLECPVCRKIVNPADDFKPLVPTSQVNVRMIYVPLVFRLDEVGDGNNNQKTVELFGHPVLLRLPNRCSTELLHAALTPLVTYRQPYKVLLVDGQGTHCARCMYHAHCPGCPVSSEGPLTFYSSDTIAITFSSPVDTPKTVTHSSMASLKSQRPLSLYDCIQAFSQSEQLDEQNPWFCPQCRKNQCATKTLSIWRYPDYLIVYLKRFIFYDRMSTKLEDKVMFPLQDLTLVPNVPLYDLYACVCHIGGVSAGHYTSYTKHPTSKEWHYFNDSYVSKQAPQEEDYSNAYILFYKQQGLQTPCLESESDSSDFVPVV